MTSPSNPSAAGERASAAKIRKPTMNKLTLEKMAVTAFANLQAKRLDLFTAAEYTITMKQGYEEAKAAMQNSGVIDGKNAEIREAQLRGMLAVELMDVTAAEKTERRCRHEFDRASIDVDTVKTLLRIAELTE
jgi:hypothetical protein